MQQHSDLPFEIFTVDGLFSREELDAWERWVAAAPVENRRFTNSGFKNGKVVLRHVAELMFARLAPHLPRTYTDRGGRTWEFVGAPDHVMYSEVMPGQRFALHTDTGCWFAPPEESKFTVLVYLPTPFRDGATQFYTQDFQPTVAVAPSEASPGRLLAFDIDLFHEGAPVTDGTKRWIGTELVCRRLCLNNASRSCEDTEIAEDVDDGRS